MTSTAWRGRTLTQYLNSMFDFAAYNLHGEMLKLEAAGKPAFLRDDRGEVVILCNDGNFCQSSVRSPDSFYRRFSPGWPAASSHLTLAAELNAATAAITPSSWYPVDVLLEQTYRQLPVCLSQLLSHARTDCNITTFDHTKPYVRELWLETLTNATKFGSVGGV